MITNFFIPELNNHDVQELWFQQDGATCHTACATIDLLKDTFGDCLISRFGPVNWPPRSCDLKGVFLESLVYADKPQMLDHLEDNIRRVIADIRPQMLEKVIENWTSRLNYIRASHGSPMPEIIFNMTATTGSDVVQSGRPIFDDFFQHLWPYIGNNTANVVSQMVKRLWHRPITLHSPRENSLAVLNHKILEANSQVQNVKLGGHQTCLSINRLWHELCDMLRRLVGTTAPGHHDCSIQE
ncbi:uncharacterized protein TNCV_2882461 [Trichonephila clavipes]|nr:uncharacterized protein TNCV_2882461 [Trichonephila clavipes]